ncbi:STAS domain-containing protein [Sphingomonas sp. RB3P16]|uniref:STAS domain-containing protein n=1 Tax=Parasphingomonas frigoris TaxID=3096163 RepID=UPI002FC9A74B
MTETIEVPQSVTVRSAAMLASRLVEAAQVGGDVVVDVAALAECDLSFVQLLLAMRTHLQGNGATLSLAQPAGPALRALLDRAGFGNSNPDDSQFWFHGEQPQ